MTAKDNQKGCFPEYYHDILLSAITHDIVGPLGFSVNVLKAMLKSEPDPKMLAAICDCLDEARIKAEEILDVMRSKVLLNTQAGKPSDTITELGKAAEKKIASLKHLYPEADFDWTMKEDALTSSSPVAVNTAIENILTNAAKYSHTGKISVRSYKKASDAILDVENAIEEDARDIAAMLSTEGVPTTHQQRACIGIFVSRSIARMGGGDITFHASENGTLYTTIRFPWPK